MGPYMAVNIRKEHFIQVDALQKEYRLVTSLRNHPRIIQFFAIIPDDRNYQIMIVMEYMEGGSLTDKFRDKKNLFLTILCLSISWREGVSFTEEKYTTAI